MYIRRSEDVNFPMYIQFNLCFQGYRCSTNKMIWNFFWKIPKLCYQLALQIYKLQLCKTWSWPQILSYVIFRVNDMPYTGECLFLYFNVPKRANVFIWTDAKLFDLLNKQFNISTWLQIFLFGYFYFVLVSFCLPCFFSDLLVFYPPSVMNPVLFVLVNFTLTYRLHCNTYYNYVEASNNLKIGGSKTWRKSKKLLNIVWISDSMTLRSVSFLHFNHN